MLPFDAVSYFSSFFSALDREIKEGGRFVSCSGYGVSITSLEEVFLKVGGDHDLQQGTEATPAAATDVGASSSPKESTEVAAAAAAASAGDDNGETFDPEAPVPSSSPPYASRLSLGGGGSMHGGSGRRAEAAVHIQVYGLVWKRLRAAGNDVSQESSLRRN